MRRMDDSTLFLATSSAQVQTLQTSQRRSEPLFRGKEENGGRTFWSNPNLKKVYKRFLGKKKERVAPLQEKIGQIKTNTQRVEA